MLVKQPRGFTTSLQSHRIVGMNLTRKQFSPNGGAPKGQIPVSTVQIQLTRRGKSRDRCGVAKQYSNIGGRSGSCG